MRAARLDKSKRLQAVFWLLSDGREHSTREISRACDLYAINSIIAELRDAEVGNGLTIPKPKRRDGGHWYHLVRDGQFYQWRRELRAQGERVNG